MGEEGFSSDSSLLYHRGVPSAIVDARSGTCPTSPRRQPPAEAPPPPAPRAVRRAGRRRSIPSPGAGWCSATTTCGSRTSSSETTSPFYRNAIGDECVYVEPGERIVETVFGVLSYRRRRLRARAPGDDASVGAEARRARLYVIEANSHIAPPKRYLSRYGQLLEHAPYCERDLRGPERAAAATDGHRRRGARQAPRRRARGPGRHQAHLRHPPVRRRRLGRLPLSLHVQRRRLRADHRPGAPAAAGAPGLRGLQLRGLQLRARARSTTTRCRSRCPTTTPTSTATR